MIKIQLPKFQFWWGEAYGNPVDLVWRTCGEHFLKLCSPGISGIRDHIKINLKQ